MDPNTLKIVDTGELKTSKGDQELTQATHSENLPREEKL